MQLLGSAFALLVGAARVLAQDEGPGTPLYSYHLRAPYLDAIMEVNRFIRLTSDVQSQEGYLWAKTPMTTNSWRIEFEFKVTHDGGIAGDGFAFWYTQERMEEGPVFGNRDKYNGLGLFFDTYANGRVKTAFPYVMAIINDGTKYYDHDTDGNNAEVGGCEAHFLNQHYVTKARVTYVHNNYLNVDLSLQGDNQWTTCFRAHGVSLPKRGYFGFSAMTGGVSSAHDIIEVMTFALNSAPERPDSEVPKPASSDDRGRSTNRASQNREQPVQRKPTTVSSSGVSAGIIVILLIVGLIVAYIGWVMYKTSKANSYKRF
nr:hypothetical protein HK105_002224 [Polyrhizophydium stewartii]